MNLFRKKSLIKIYFCYISYLKIKKIEINKISKKRNFKIERPFKIALQAEQNILVKKPITFSF
jgi:hypothetical protein